MKVLKSQIIRENDVFGSGAFGASRGSRTHKGVDIIAQKGDYVEAPFPGVISKHGYCYNDSNFWRYIEIQGEKYRSRILYAELDSGIKEGQKVREGQFLGVVQGIEDRYPGITPHIHFELYTGPSSKDYINPTTYIKKKKLVTNLVPVALALGLLFFKK